MSELAAEKVDVKQFYMRRIHSLLGVFPVSIFLVEHMFANAFILRGPEAYNGVIHLLRSLPYLVTIEVLFIGLPIFLHAFYGIYITVTGSVNVKRYNYAKNWFYVLQRVSGLIALAFIGYHIWDFRIASEVFGFEVTYSTVGEAMRIPWKFWFYVVGLVATMFHFANGLWLFCITWGITVGKKAQKISGLIWGSAGLVLFLIALQSMITVAK